MRLGMMVMMISLMMVVVILVLHVLSYRAIIAFCSFIVVTCFRLHGHSGPLII